MRRRFLMIPLLAFGCAREVPKAVSRVALPAGIKRPPGLKSDPPSPADGDEAPSTQATSRQDDPSVAGACRYGETVACWNVHGEPDPRLTDGVKGLLVSRHDPIPVRFGARNRIVVVDLPSSGGEWSYRISTDASPNESTEVRGAAGRQLLFVDEKARGARTSVTVVQSRRLPGTALLVPQAGARVALNGGQVMVDSVTPVKPGDMMAFFLKGAPGWKIVARPSPESLPTVAFQPVDPYPMATADGSRARLRKDGSLEAAPKDAPRIQNVSGDVPIGGFVALIDCDPAKVKAIAVFAAALRTLKFPGIPLDAR